ncbi:MAG TPA: hypothetical protein VK857_14470 [Desulforhopalus sp.]|jgi:hypothetical protein|nr:hypothetical protein [Desulforhopalus sp.]
MSEQPEIVRIWVALDDSPRSAAALLTATALAAELDAELAGLFVEDIDLEHLCRLPFAREYSALTGVGRPLAAEEIERAWRREARAMQLLLAEAAARSRLRWSFRVARGRVGVEVSTLARALDLIVLGRRSGMGMTVVHTTHLLADLHQRVGPVLVLFESVAVSSRSLETAAKLARSSGAELVLLIRDGDPASFRAGCLAARALLQERSSDGRCFRLGKVATENLLQAVRREGAGCLVLAGRERFLRQAGFERMLDALDCPVVLAG